MRFERTNKQQAYSLALRLGSTRGGVSGTRARAPVDACVEELGRNADALARGKAIIAT